MLLSSTNFFLVFVIIKLEAKRPETYSDYINITNINPEYLLTPTSSGLYNAGFQGEWKVLINTSNETLILEINAYSYMRENDYLSLYICKSGKIVLDSKLSMLQQQLFYTQEEEICIKFNASKEPINKEKYYWTINFKLMPKPISEIIEFSETVPIHFTNYLRNFTQYHIKNNLNGTLEIYYEGINLDGYPYGNIYIFESSVLKNFSMTFMFPSENTLKFISTTSKLTLFYVGTTSNNIVIVSRIIEYHSKNCLDKNNLDILPALSGDIDKQISSTNGGACIYSIITPYFKAYGNLSMLVMSYFIYEGIGEVWFVSGTNDNYTLFKFNQKTSTEWTNAHFMGSLVSIIIPPNGNLYITYHSFVDIISHPQSTITFNKIYHYFAMTPNYPNNITVGNLVDSIKFSCDIGLAAYTISLNADIPENCPLMFYADEKSAINIVNTTVNNLTLYFNATNLTVVFNGSQCPESTFKGYAYQIDAYYIEPTKIETPNYPLIIGLSGGGIALIFIFVVSIAAWHIRRRQKRYQAVYKILREFSMSAKQIDEMKSKSDEFLIRPGKIHIQFSKIFGKGANATVYKGRLVGPALERQNSSYSEKFIDCDVAVKVTNHLGKTEIKHLFKEIDAMKRIGYHENVMCMLGWTLPGETPCLVFEMARKDLLNYLWEFREVEAELVPYRTFMSILWQITKGMQYIASKSLAHNDLAARNILLFENFNAKISDFGLCCSLDDTLPYDPFENKKFPIKWLPLEALIDKVFSEKSDVWSFGILMYEVFTFGKVPYENMNNDELVVFLQSGGRLERAGNVDDICYGVMMSCWNKVPVERPNFVELDEKFCNYIEEFWN